MNKKIVLIITIAILTFSAMVAVYAIDSNDPISIGFKSSTPSTSDSKAFKSMIDLMRSNGFEEAAKAMENRNYDAMNEFMEDITDDQYKKMIDVMRDNGYESMANMMSSFSREEMINMHNSMMNR